MPVQPAPPAVAQTRQSLAEDLRALGIRAGQVLLVHASLRKLGPVAGGAGEVVAALRQAVGRTGTLVVPTGTAGNSDTSREFLSRTTGLTDGQIARYKAAMPPFDPATTPSQGMGRLAETIRTTPGAVRSIHPQTSFAALGPRARQLTSGHAMDCHLGESSPLGRLYEEGAWILLLGVGFAACSAFHLAEYRYAPDPPTRRYRCVIDVGGRAVWHEYRDVVLDDREFGEMGADFNRATGLTAQGRVGRAESRLLPMVPMVDYAVNWLRQRRPADL
jgi:aminoglycoside 3-N-acetyltransferase